jgi:ParB family chromosome partitioning protein
MNSRSRSQLPTDRSKLKNVALFVEENDSEVLPQTLPLTQIVCSPSQPRRYFDSQSLSSLKESIAREGILQPILVRPSGEKYELVVGERRYRAASELGLPEIPVTVRDLSDEQARQYALMENLQREDLNPVEETEGILELLAFKLNKDREGVISLLNQLANVKRGITDNVVRNEEQQIVERVFQDVGRFSAESFRTHRLPLLRLPEEILEALRQGQIEYTKAKAIDRVKEEDSRKQLLKEAISHSLSLSQIRERIKSFQSTQQKDELLSRLDITYRQVRKAKQVLDNPKQRKKLESLLAQLEKLIAAGG